MQQIILMLGFFFASTSLFATPPSGSLDNSFGTGGIVVTDIGSSASDAAYGSAVQPDGKVVVVGSSGTSSMAMVRYTIAGVPDSEFGTGGKVTQAIGGGSPVQANAVAILPNGKIVCAGFADTGATQFFVAQFLSNGALDTVGFNAGGTPGYILVTVSDGSTDDQATSLVVDASGNIYVAGTSYQGVTDGYNIFVAKLTSAGVLDTSYNSGFAVGGGGSGTTQEGIALLSISATPLSANSIGLTSTGKIVVCGAAGTSAIVAQFATNGTLDTAAFNASTGYNIQALGSSVTAVAYSLGFQSDHKIIIAGSSDTNAVVARFATDGTLDTSFNASDGYNAANTFGGLLAVNYGLAIQADDKIVVGGTVTNTGPTTDFVIARYLANGSALDDPFGGVGYTVTDISGSSSVDTGRSLSMQSNGRFIVAGTTDSGSGDFAVVRYLGNAAPQGCINVSYDESSSGAQDGGYRTYPTDATSSHKPQVKALQVLASNSVFVLTEDLATTRKCQLVQVDAAGSTTSLNAIAPIDIAQTGGADVISDSHGRALVVGGNATPQGWIARYVPTVGTPGSFAFDSTFNRGNILLDNRATSFARVCEQKSGTILAMGQSNGGTYGIIVAYNQNGTTNTSFGNGAGYYQINNITFTDMVVDSADNIYVIGSADGGNIQLYRILPDGSGLDLDYNSGNPINTGLASGGYQGAKLSGINDFLGDDGIGGTTLMTVNNSTKAFEFQRYDSDGLASTPASNSIPQSVHLLSNPVMTQLQIDSNDFPVYVGYDDDYFFIGRLQDDLTIDTAFAPYSSCPGILKTKYDDVNPTDGTSPQRVANCLGISPSGAIVFGGYENIDSTHTVSVVGNIVGGDAISELVRYPGAEIGQVDTTFGTDGILAVPGALPSDAGMQLYVLPNNKILVTYSANPNTILEQLNSDYSVDGSFGATGIRTLTGLANPTNMMVDESGNIYVVGDNGSGQMMLFKISSTGTLLWSNSSSSLSLGNVVLQQVSGRIIVAGYNGSSGVIAGYSPINGALDLDFAGEGYYTTGVNAQIIGAAVTSSDKIVFTYMNADNIAVIQQIYSNGSGLDTGFGTGTQTLLLADGPTEIRMQLDVDGKIVVVTKAGDGEGLTPYYYVASRYTASGNDDVINIIITPTSITAPYLQDVITLSDGSTLVLGIDDTGNTLEMFRLTSAFAQDMNFNYPSGFLETTITGTPSDMSMFLAFDVTADQGILVVGKTTAEGGAFNRVYNDSCVTKVNQNQSDQSNLDPSFGPGGYATFSLSQYDQLNAMAIQSDGKIVVGGYTTVADYSQFFIARYNVDGSLDTAGFNNAGGTPGYRITTQGLYSQIHAVAIQADGKILAGGLTENDYMLVRYNSDGTLDNDFGGTGHGGIVTGTFGSTTGNRIYSLVIQPSNQYIVVGGQAYGDIGEITSIQQFLVARFDTTGVLDTTGFNAGDTQGYILSPILNVDGLGNSFINSIALQADGKIVGGGSSRASDVDAYQFAVARYTTAGLLDTGTFGSGLGYVTTVIGGYDDEINAIAIEPASQQIIAGGYSAADEDMIAYSFALASYSSTGASLHTAGTSINGYYDVINAVALQADGKILVAGNAQITSESGPYEFVVARYLPDLSLDTSDSFGNGNGYVVTAINGIDDTINAMVMQGDGKIVVAGFTQIGTAAGPLAMVVARYMNGAEAGSLDTTYNPTGTNPGFLNMSVVLTPATTDSTYVKALLQLADGSYYVAADDGTNNTYVTYYSSDDLLQTGFGSSGILAISGGSVSGMLLTQSGQLLVIGAATESGSQGWVKLYNATTGAAVIAFAPTALLTQAFSVVQQSEGRIIVAGQIGGVGTLIAYNSVSGAIDTTFGTNGYYTATGYGAINSMVVDATDCIYFIANDSSNLAKTTKLSPTAASVLWLGDSFVTNSTISSNNHIAIDQSGNIVIAAVNTTAEKIVMKRYFAADGVTSETYDLTTGVTGFGNPMVNSLAIDATPASAGNIILTGYDESDAPVTPYVLRVLADLSGLDTTFNATGIQTIQVPTATGGIWYDAIINQEGKIRVGGYANPSDTNTSYLMQLYGNSFVGQYLPTVSAGTPGTIDTNFGTSGYVALTDVSGALAGLTPQVVLPIANGDYYIAFTSGALIRLTNGAELDDSFDTDGFASASTAGVQSMFIDGSNRLVLAGTNGGAAWLQRYNAGLGTLDTTFNSNAVTALTGATLGTVAIQQTLGRYVLAGQLASGNGALYALTNSGQLDVTFNSNGTAGAGGGGTTPGIFDTGVANGVYALISDVYDRLIIAYKNGTGIDIVRFTSAGQIDTTFGSSGTISGAIANADSTSQVRLSFDSSGNIVVAAHFNDGANKIAVKAYANGSGTTVVETQYDITGLTSPTLTGLITTADGKVLVSGYQTGSNDMWVARIKDNGSGAYTFDTAFGGGDGIMTFSFAGSVDFRNLACIAMYGDGQIAMVGTETPPIEGMPIINPFLAMAYDNPYTSQTVIGQNSEPVGTNDITLGASSVAATALGVVFYASSGADATAGQVARAIALQDDANILVAVDGGASNGATTPSQIFLKMFNIDGTLQTTFGTAGQQTVLTSYQNQFVNDMVTFTTVAGVHKAILAGYVTNTTPSLTGSLLLQYNLDTHALDTSFGGANGNIDGTACGDCKQINCVGLQSNGRIIATGLNQSNQGVILGYTSTGKLDSSFGNSGYQATNTGATGIYSHAIDSENRIVIVYNDGTDNVDVVRFLPDGSDLDSSFTITSPLLTASGNTSMKVAVDTSNNVYVVAVGSTPNNINVIKYNATGTSQLGVSVNLLWSDLGGGSSSASYTLSRLLVDTSGNVIVVAYDTNGSDTIVVVRLTSSLALDTSNFDVPNGYLLYAVSTGTTQVAKDAMIHPDGRILIVGSEV